MAAVVATNWRPMGKNTLVGFCDLEIPHWKLQIKGVMWHRRASDGREWISFPGREYIDKDGSKKYVDIVVWSDRDVHFRFQRAALEAVHAIAGGPQEPAPHGATGGATAPAESDDFPL